MRKYDDKVELIEIICGSNDLYEDVKKLYTKEFDEARKEYNEKQTRNDRKIEDYFFHISNNSKNDLAVEIIIELGNMEFWKDKEESYKRKMTEVFKEQIRDLEKIVPSFKVANAVVHYDEASPHLHIVGVPVKDKNKNGMKKQVGKSTIFTKESLKEIQNTIRVYCKESFNKIYQTNIELLEKLEGRNEDIETKNMSKQYDYLKKQADKNRQRLEKVNRQTELTLSKSKEVKEIISNLKPTKITKNNFIINDDELDIINNYIESVDKNVSDIKSVNDLTNLMEDFEMNLKNHDIEVNELRLKVDEQAKRITTLERQNISKQDKIAEQRKEIKELEHEISRLEKIVQMWQNLWQRIRDFFQDKFFSSKKKDIIYEQVVDDMVEENILDNDDIDYIQNNYYSTKKDNKGYDL
ncbi:MAG: hypothetical protein HFJ02_03640 [Bacilli bacterium]|nr:hypothetical protein [Bacilli bacterium]